MRKGGREVILVHAPIVVPLLVYQEQNAHCTERVAREDSFHAPALIDAEVASAIGGLLRATPAVGMSAERAEELLDDVSGLPITRYLMLPFLRAPWTCLMPLRSSTLYTS